MKIEKFNKNDIEFSKNLLNEPSETILNTLSSNKLKHLMLILDRKSTRLNSSHSQQSRMPSSA